MTDGIVVKSCFYVDDSRSFLHSLADKRPRTWVGFRLIRSNDNEKFGFNQQLWNLGINKSVLADHEALQEFISGLEMDFNLVTDKCNRQELCDEALP